MSHFDCTPARRRGSLTYDAGPTRDLAGEAFAMADVWFQALRRGSSRLSPAFSFAYTQGPEKGPSNARAGARTYGQCHIGHIPI